MIKTDKVRFTELGKKEKVDTKMAKVFIDLEMQAITKPEC